MYLSHKFLPCDFADNRAWTNPENKSQLGCIGKDYVKDSNLLVFRYFWNATHQVLAGTVEFTSATEGPPGVYDCHHLVIDISIEVVLFAF